MDKYNYVFSKSGYCDPPNVQAADLQDCGHGPLYVGDDLSDWGEPGALAGHQLPPTLELFTCRHWPMSLLQKKYRRLNINKAKIWCTTHFICYFFYTVSTMSVGRGGIICEKQKNGEAPHYAV